MNLWGWFSQHRWERDKSEELRGHIDRQTTANIAAGMPPQEARRQAVLLFGGLEAVKENCREQRRGFWLESLWADVRYGLRALRRNPGFAAVAILALALGIGASTVVFSVVYNVFFQALPYKNFNRSVVVEMRNLGGVGGRTVRQYFSPAEVRAFREQNHELEDIVAHVGMRPTYNDGKSTRFFSFGAIVTTNTFDFLGVPALLGRTILPEDGNLPALRPCS